MRRLLLLTLLGCKLHVGVGDRPKLLGKTGEEFVAEAKAAMDGSDWLSAGVLLGPAAKLIEVDPLRDRYKGDAIRLNQQLTEHLQNEFPMRVATDPPVDVYRFSAAMIEKDPELMPKINYVHPKGMTLGPEINPFAEKLHEKLAARFPGLRTRFRHVVYTAFDEPPTDPTRTYARFGSIIDTATGRVQPSKN